LLDVFVEQIWGSDREDLKEYDMKMFVTKMALATSVALATFLAAETAYTQENSTAPNASYAQQHSITPHPNDVRAGNRWIGRDPDPFIRGEILRHYDSGWPD
jgi:hypothetical protein